MSSVLTIILAEAECRNPAVVAFMAKGHRSREEAEEEASLLESRYLAHVEMDLSLRGEAGERLAECLDLDGVRENIKTLLESVIEQAVEAALAAKNK